MNMRHLLFYGRGFTLIELIVTTSIIAFMSLIVLTGYRSADRRAVLHLETQKFAGDIRRVQNMALGSLDANGVTPAGGWGVYIVNSGTYYIFADSNANNQYNAGDTLAQTVTLSPKILFSAGVGTSVVFLPPDPRVYLDGVNSGSAIVTLRQADDATVTRSVTLNAFGLVDISE